MTVESPLGGPTSGPPEVRLWIDGQQVDGCSTAVLEDPFRRDVVATVHQAGAKEVAAAMASARRGQTEVAEMSVSQRATRLRAAARAVAERREEFARTISRQTGKAIRDARREIDRSMYTLQAVAAAAETVTISLPPSDAVPGGEGLFCVVRREPLGVVSAITPFNAPFNLVMHKVAPALAGGNAVVVKPAPSAPLSAMQVAEVFDAVGWPKGSVCVLPGDAEVARGIAGHEGADAVSFTGGVAAGHAIAAAALGKRVLLELGGNSANIVDADADLAWATKALVAGAFSNTGQSCNSVQRVLVHAAVAPDLEEMLARATRAMVCGDPLDAVTDVGTLVNEDAAIRVAEALEFAEKEGARVVVGGERTGAAVQPAVVCDVHPEMAIARQEIFGPVLLVSVVSSIDQAIAMANNTPYGLQGAIFTRSLAHADLAARSLRVGTVLVNRSTNFRLDNFPFGGVKASGNTREGGRFTIEEMTSVKTVLIDAAMAGSPHPLASTR